MPLELGPLPIRIGVTVQDRDGNTAEAINYRQGITTIVDAEAQVQAFAAVLAPVTDGFLISANLSIPLIQTDPFALPPEGSEVARKGRFVFRTVNGRTAKYEVPSIANTLVNDRDRNGAINVSDLAVAAYIAYMEASLNGAGVEISNLEQAFKAHRRTRRG